MPALPTQQGRLVLPGDVDYVRRWGVVEHWAGNEASGPRLASISSANDMTAVNAPGSAAGLVYPTARQYTAASLQYHNVVDSAALSAADVDFWIAVDDVVLNSKGTSNTAKTIVAKFQPGTSREWQLSFNFNADRFRFAVSPAADGTGETAVLANALGSPSLSTRYLLVAYHDSVNNLLGISGNGGAFTTAAYSAGGRDGAAPFSIGASSNPGDYQDGRIGPAVFGKSPPGGIAAVATEIRDAMYRNGAGLQFPFRH